VTQPHRVLQGDALDRLQDLPANSVQTCITSPPYWGMRDYDVEGQLGLEESLQEHIDALVDVFDEVSRVLRPDGTLWLNYGDGYAGSWGAQGSPENYGDDEHEHRPAKNPARHPPGNLQPKSLMGMPWRVAFAMQDAGWILRSEIIWHKKNPMPESVTDRPTNAHEYVFLFTQDQDYFYDDHAIREPASENTNARGSGRAQKEAAEDTDVKAKASFYEATAEPLLTRNKRSVWSLTTEPYSEAHFATFPTKLVEPMVKAGTSEEGCCSECGAPIKRVLSERETRGDYTLDHGDRLTRGRNSNDGLNGREFYEKICPRETLGWDPTCDCRAMQRASCTVLDPFAGSGTTGRVAKDLGRHSVGIELNRDYVALAQKRIGIPVDEPERLRDDDQTGLDEV